MATSEKTCCEDIDNILLAQRSPRFELDAIANVVKKTVRAYRLKEFDKLLAVIDPTNNVDFVKEISLYIIHLIFVIFFYLTLF